MEIEAVNGELVVKLTKEDAQEIVSVLAYEFISPEKQVLKEFVSEVIHFSEYDFNRRKK